MRHVLIAAFACLLPATAFADADAILAAAAKDCAEMDGGVFASEGAVRQIDMTGDGTDDTIVDEALFTCSTAASLYGGSGGSIVNVSSAAARLGAPGQYVDYAAAKSAIDAFTIGLAKEVAAEGIRVNAVRPGLIDTDIHASGGLPNRVRDLAHLVPMQRGGTSEEVAQAIVWLLSDASSYTTMSLMEISGGR